MPKNATKDLQEKYEAGLKELEKRHQEYQADVSNADKRRAFDEQMEAVKGAKSEWARSKAYDDMIASGRTDLEIEGRRDPQELAGMTPQERRSDNVCPIANPDAKGYSLSRAVNAMAEGRKLSGVELEVSQELQKRNASLQNGKSREFAFSIPLTLQFSPPGSNARSMARLAGMTDAEARALNVTTGATAIPTILSGTLLEMLRAKVVMQRAGATVLTGITGVFDMPKQSAQPSVTIGGEGVTQSESSAQVASKVTFTPKTITSQQLMTRRFLVQAMQSMDAENWLRGMALNQIALGIDTECINGPGTANRCTGLLQNGSVTTVALGTNGAAITFGKCVDMETSVADANGDGTSMAYVTNAKGRGSMKQTLRASASGSDMIWQNDEVNGYPALMSNLVPKNLTKGSGTNLSAMLFGDFSQAVIALWTGADVLVDPYTGGPAGSTNIYVYQDFDFQVRYAEAFSKIVDMIA